MMIMWADRQDFDNVTGHMYLKLTFIGLTFLCQQKTSQNKQFLSAPQTVNILQHQDQDYVKDKD